LFRIQRLASAPYDPGFGGWVRNHTGYGFHEYSLNYGLIFHLLDSDEQTQELLIDFFSQSLNIKKNELHCFGVGFIGFGVVGNRFIFNIE